MGKHFIDDKEETYKIKEKKGKKNFFKNISSIPNDISNIGGDSNLFYRR